jgi:UDP-N-acetylmuramate dehydrogenase
MLGEIKHNVSLKPLSYLHVGGKARHFFIAKSIGDIFNILDFWFSQKGLKNKRILILGGGTNILFSDKVFNGLVLKIDMNFIKIVGKDVIFSGAGTSMVKLLKFCLKNKFAGLEWTARLPGTLGGAVRGNAGCFGGEIKDSVIGVASLDFINGSFYFRLRNNRDCDFGYRSSIFKKITGKQNFSVILWALLKMSKKNDISSEKSIAESNFAYRLKKQPIKSPTLGSTFKNIPVQKVSKEVLKEFSHKIKEDPFPILPVAVLLNAVKLKGIAYGGAEFSQKHPNFIINTGKARASDVKKLISLAKKRVKGKFGVRLEEEIEIV